ncbi:hypothetical protein tb265_17130 [Gemmatimonadetes bacterium T265]|nr:hypothetical protein tb265_17130 [Gemmatimonadetes bacterium T265]
MATAIRVDDALRPPTTAEELLLMPEGTHGEIVEGVYVEMTAPGGVHGLVTMRVGRVVGNVIDERGLGAAFGAETAFRLKRDPDLVRCPDFAFVTAARLAAVLRVGANEGAPDLAVEVVSPSNTATEVNGKLAEYFRYGARQVWLVDPATRTVAAHVVGQFPRFLGGDDVLDGGDLLPGFSTPVAAFFAGLPPAA